MKIKNSFHRTAIFTALALAFLTATPLASLRAATVTVGDSIVSLATNATKTYTFTDPNSVQSVAVAVTMTAYSPTITPTSLQSLDGDTRVGGNNQNGFIDGSGVNFSASLVSSSSGVASGSVKFAITALGIRPSDGSGTVNWTSSAGTKSVFLGNGNEVMQALDATNAALNYSAQLRFPESAQMQLTDVPAPGQSIVFAVTFTSTVTNDAQTSAWLTTYAGKYARITTNDATRTAGTSVTTWNNGVAAEAQTLPAYCGVQEIYASTNWIYFRTTGLGSHTMGPWYNDATRIPLFINWPVNQKILYRIPRTVTAATNIPAVKTGTAGPDAPVGYFVDGVAMYDPSDGFSYSGGSEASPGTGQWHRDAYVNEYITFDVGNSHQQNTGQYHNHADPIALRYLLGDNILMTASNTYVENITNGSPKHSPIIGWVRDGLPMYGPYGYASPTNASSGVRRMVAGFVLRNGQNGTDNLTNTARATLPAWMLRNNGNTAASGPAVSATYPLGRYNQDNAYLGDLTNSQTGQKYVLGTDFDLNEYNVRWCVTPEFPGGTWAYFVCITSNGTPTFPYNLNYYFYGNPTGGTITNITETNLKTNFLGNTNLVSKMSSPAYLNGGFVSLKWTGIDGGTYQIEGSTNLTAWTSLAGGLTINTYATNGPGSSYLDSVGALDKRFYRASRTAVAAFDPLTGIVGSTAQGITSIAPASGNRSTTAVTTIVLNSSYSPAPPPASNPPTSVTLTRSGATTITGTSVSRNSTSGVVSASFVIPANATTGIYTVNCIFGPNTWSLTNGFTVN